MTITTFLAYDKQNIFDQDPLPLPPSLFAQLERHFQRCLRIIPCVHNAEEGDERVPHEGHADAGGGGDDGCAGRGGGEDGSLLQKLPSTRYAVCSKAAAYILHDQLRYRRALTAVTKFVIQPND